MNDVLRDAILKAVANRQEPLWLVGGPVRDGFSSIPCKDWDFVCRRARQVAQGAAKRLKAKFIVLDEQNRIYRVILPSPRDKSGPLPGERELLGEGLVTLDFAELQGKTIEQDLGRRDISFNAMARLFPAGPLIDPFHGEKDLRRRLVRAVSEKAFKDDPLRCVRVFRFIVQFGGQADAKTLRWIKKHCRLLDNVSAERIREELLRFWKQPKVGPVLRLMDRTGLLTVIFPEIEACRRTAIRYYGKGGVLKHSFESVDNLEYLFDHLGSVPIPRSAETPIRTYLQESIGGYPRLAWLKWGAFLHDIGKPATAKMIKGRLRFFEHEHVGASEALKVGQRLRLSRQETHLLALWVRNHMRTGNLAAAPRLTDRALSRYFRDLGEEGVGMILISLADHYTYLRKGLWGKGTDSVEKISLKLLSSYYEERARILPERLVDGHFVMKILKLKPGPVIGKLLSALQDAQAGGKVSTKEEALEWLKRKAQLLKR